MRKDFLLFLSFLVDAGYIVSFRVTKDKIFIEEKKLKYPLNCGVGAAKRGAVK